MNPMNPPATKPSLETCASLIAAAQNELNRCRNEEDEDTFDEARTAYLRAYESAKRHGYTVDQLRAALASLPPKKLTTMKNPLYSVLPTSRLSIPFTPPVIASRDECASVIFSHQPSGKFAVVVNNSAIPELSREEAIALAVWIINRTAEK